MRAWHDASMSRRFALGAAGLAAAAVLLVSLASWWLINRSHVESLRALAATERQFRAEAVGSDLQALAERMQEMSQSTILASGLVDSSGRDTYLAPFLSGIRQISGVPVHVLFADFEGREIASNGTGRFSESQLAWLRGRLPDGQPAAAIFEEAERAELVALAPMRYDSARPPDGALFYKIALADLYVGESLSLVWNGGRATHAQRGDGATVPVPALFEPLGIAVRTAAAPAARLADLAPEYLAIALIAIALFATVVLAGARLARVLTHDLDRLQDFSSRFIGSALDEQRAPVGGSQEVSSLASSINTMLDRLEEQRSTLLQEREKLKRLTDALQVADRRKDDFLAMLAHELRNPLAPILNGAELLRRLPGSDPRMLRTSDIIARQAMHMREILEDLLDVSRVTRGLITLDRQPQDLADVTRMAVEQVRPLVDARGHRLDLDIAAGSRCVLGDQSRLIQIVTNLLTNAAKYTPRGGHIRLRVLPVDGQVRITVRGRRRRHRAGADAGAVRALLAGVACGRSQPGRSRPGARTGAAAGRAARRQRAGGERRAGQRLHLHRAAAGARSGGSGAGQRRAGGRRAGAGAQPLQILITDDNADAAASLANALELDGHAVRVVHDAPGALRLLDELSGTHWDALLLDIGLPGMDGYQLAAALRKRADTRRTRLIAITGYGQPEDRLRSLEAGFDHHLVKPVDTAELGRLLRSIQPPAKAAPSPPSADASATTADGA